MPQSPAVAVPTLAAQRRQIIRNDQLATRSNLNGEQTALELGQAIPLVIGLRTGNTGGVLLSPPASECRFTNDEANRVTASYELVLADGQLGAIAAADAYQGDTQLAPENLIQAYNGRAGTWAPGNFIQQRFSVTTSSTVQTVEGKAIGSGPMLDLAPFSDEELALHIDEQVAKLSLKSSGNYVTKYEVSITKAIDWPTVGRLAATKGSSAFVAGSGGSATIDPSAGTAGWYATQPWESSSGGIAGPTPDPGQTGPAITPYGSGVQIWWTAANSWLTDRTQSGRYFNVTGYNVNRPASTEPFGGIDVELTETINGAFLQPITATFLARDGTYYATIYGGFPAVSYTVTVTEENSEPLPKPEATLYCGTGGSYAGLTTVSVSRTYPAGDEGWRRQSHFFIRQGQPILRLIEGSAGPTNLLPDVAYHLLVASKRVPAQLIDTTALTAAARFCATNGITFDGAIANPANVREWLALVAPLHLLRVTDRWGQIGLRPALPVTAAHTIDTSPLTPVMVFDESTILGELSATYRPAADRKPFCALVLWRDQPENDIGVPQATEVRYQGMAIDGPYSDIDGAEFITRELHAVRAGALALARRQHVTHDASWQVAPSPAVAALRSGDIVRVNLARNPTTGAPSVWSYLYEIERLSGPPAGPWTIEASHHPVDDLGASLLARDVAGASIA